MSQEKKTKSICYVYFKEEAYKPYQNIIRIYSSRLYEFNIIFSYIFLFFYFKNNNQFKVRNKPGRKTQVGLIKFLILRMIFIIHRQSINKKKFISF